jgi:hypothetical protein
MVQCGRGLGFALKTGEGLRVFDDVIGEKFQRDKAVKIEVFRFVHNTHATAA